MYLPAKYRKAIEEGYRVFKPIIIPPKKEKVKYQKPKEEIIFYKEWKTYFAKSNGIIKIGRSKQPKNRMQALSYQLKKELNLVVEAFELIGFIHKDLEKAIHNQLKTHSIKGEWYPNDVFMNQYIDYILKKEELPKECVNQSKPIDLDSNGN